MNQTDFNTNMVWMGQFAPDRSMIIEDNAAFYHVPTAQIGMSMMDDSTPPSTMDVNQIMGYIGDYQNGSAVCLPTGSMQMPSTAADMFNMAGNTGGGGGGNLQTQYLLASPYVLSQELSNDMHGVVDNQSYMLQVSDDDEELLEPHMIKTDEMVDDMYDQDAEDNSNQQHSSSIDGDEQKYVMRASMMGDGGGGGGGIVVDGGVEFYEQEPLSCSDMDNSQLDFPMRQVLPPTSKKIKPIERPGLVLKTPIAYQPCQDPSVIPIQRDGMAVCQRCGAIGVKHSFYTKERRYCSMSCARNAFAKVTVSSPSPSSRYRGTRDLLDSSCDIEGELDSSDMQPMDPQLLGYEFKLAPGIKEEDGHVLFKDLLPQGDLPQLDRPESPSSQEKIVSVRRKDKKKYYTSFNWETIMDDHNFTAAPVTCFKHTPGYDTWRNICVGLKVEVENTDVENNVSPTQLGPHSFWVAAIVKIYGYKAKIRYEGFTDDSRDFWINLCSSEVHPVGWCAQRGKPLIPPRTIVNKYIDWKKFLVQRLSGARTLPSKFYSRIDESMQSRFRPGMILELVDKLCISKMRVATIANIVGKRLYVRYYDSSPDDNGFWCHEDSQLIHPVGWSKMVGHNLSAPAEYLQRMEESPIRHYKCDTTIDLFKLSYRLEDYAKVKPGAGFRVGMKLEAIDPLNLSRICAATVMAVLKFGYIMIRIDSYASEETTTNWFCYHEKSTCIFPVGFCDEHNIELNPPCGQDEKNFCWETYLKDINATAAPQKLFQRDVPRHGFEVGMRVECCDLMDPSLVCVATVALVVGRLLRVHFDGWNDEFDQWLDCESPDIFPIGWCVLVGHALQNPSDGCPERTKKKPVYKRKKRKLKKDGTPKTNLGRPTSLSKKTASFTPVQLHELPQDDEDNESEDMYSRSGQSTPLTITPEPTNERAMPRTPSTTLQTSSNSPTPAPPHERKATSYINQAPATSGKYIPRLIDPTNSAGDSAGKLCPETWNIYDVAVFLRVNEWGAYTETFGQKKIDGKAMLQITKDEMMEGLNIRVGPALKIYELIQQLKYKANPNSRPNKPGNVKYL